MDLVRAAVADLGTGWASDLFFAAERGLLDPPQSGRPAAKGPPGLAWDWAGKTTIITPTDPAAGISRA